MNSEDDRSLILAMILFLISAGLQIATTHSHHNGGTWADIMAPAASSTIQPHQ